MEMKKEIKDKVVNTNQKYLEKFLSQDVPEKLEKQLENMDWSYIDMINNKEQKRGTFSPLEACDIIYQLADALMHAHEHGVVHRDIKPQNVMMQYDGGVKLLDFGIATINDAPNITQKDMVVGSGEAIADQLKSV